MHLIDAEIVIVNDTADIPLGRVNKYTISNTGSADVQFGYKNNMITLRQGQATGFESGANSWFQDNLALKIRFSSAKESDVKECTVMICRVLKPSEVFLGLGELLKNALRDTFKPFQKK